MLRINTKTIEKYCVLCKKTWGPYMEKCCTNDSLIIVHKYGFFKKKTKYFDLEGNELSKNDLSNIRAQEKIALCDKKCPKECNKSIWGTGDTRSVEPLIATLKNNGPSVVVEALGKIGDERVIEPLIAALKDEDSSVRYQAGKALGKIGWKPSTWAEQFCYLIATENWAELIKIGHPAIEPLVYILKDENSNVRRQVVEALGKIGDIQTVEPLIMALKDKSGNVRIVAAKALGTIGDARSVDPLIKALGDRESDVADAAADALVKIDDPRARKALSKRLKKAGQVEYLLIMKRGSKPLKEDWYINQVLQDVVSKNSLSPSIKIKARWQTGVVDQYYAIAAALIDFGDDVNDDKYDIMIKDFRDTGGDGGKVLIAYHKDRVAATEGSPPVQRTDLPQTHLDCEHDGMKYTCRVCKRSFCNVCLNKHACFIGELSGSILAHTFGGAKVGGTIYTFDNYNLAWCPNCVRTFQQMRVVGRTISRNQ